MNFSTGHHEENGINKKEQEMRKLNIMGNPILIVISEQFPQDILWHIAG